MRYIILVRPSSMMKTLLAMIRPFMSAKAHQKIKSVRALSSVAADLSACAHRYNPRSLCM